MQTSPDPYLDQAKRNRFYWILGGALLLMALLVGTVGSRLLFSGQSAGGPVTKAGQEAGGGVTEARTPPPAPVTRVEAEPQPMTPKMAKTMPQDVLDWLKHLERTEKKRHALATEQISALLAQMVMLSGIGATDAVAQSLLDDPEKDFEKTPATEIRDQTRAQKREWRDLIAYFDSVPPPTECVPIRNAYGTALGETQSMIFEVLDAIGTAAEDPKLAVQSLMNLRGKSHSRIDVSARETDGLVQDICDKYDTRKWFSIAGDVGGGMGGVLGGLSGLGR
jgi:hypothetical protein